MPETSLVVGEERSGHGSVKSQVLGKYHKYQTCRMFRSQSALTMGIDDAFLLFMLRQRVNVLGRVARSS